MRSFLIVLFSSILLAMIGVTTAASFEQNIVAAGRELISNRWFQATLCDAYFGFITFYVWVAYKERTIRSRVIWFVLIMSLGNIAMAIYVLLQLKRLPRGDSLGSLLLRAESNVQANIHG